LVAFVGLIKQRVLGVNSAFCIVTLGRFVGPPWQPLHAFVVCLPLCMPDSILCCADFVSLMLI